MTIRQISTQLVNLAVGGMIDEKEFTARELVQYIKAKLISAVTCGGAPKVLMKIELPDGEWHFTVFSFCPGADGYDYWIPENRRREAYLIKMYG